MCSESAFIKFKTFFLFFFVKGFADAGDQMRELFEDEYIQQNIAEVMSAITPLYKNLFTYVRSKLIERYGDRIREDGPLPAHVLGNMWAQNWEGLFELVQPFPAGRKLDVTLDMMIQGITPLRYVSRTNTLAQAFERYE